MTLTRRRFLTIASAAVLARPARADVIWRGRALGAEATISLSGDAAGSAVTAALDTVRRMERLFSLYDPSSALVHLNATGTLSMPPEFAALIAEVDRVHGATAGLFDPTVQARWQDLARGHGGCNHLEGWSHVKVHGSRISLPDGMKLTLNGIAQGFATDRVKASLAAHGQTDVVVNIGEIAVGSAPAQIGVDQGRGLVRTLTLQREAVASSDPDALRLAGGESHILHPQSCGASAPRRVSIVAPTACLADGLSTALSLSDDAALATELLRNGLARRIFIS